MEQLSNLKKLEQLKTKAKEIENNIKEKKEKKSPKEEIEKDEFLAYENENQIHELRRQIEIEKYKERKEGKS